MAALPANRPVLLRDQEYILYCTYLLIAFTNSDSLLSWASTLAPINVSESKKRLVRCVVPTVALLRFMSARMWHCIFVWWFPAFRKRIVPRSSSTAWHTVTSQKIWGVFLLAQSVAGLHRERRQPKVPTIFGHMVRNIQGVPGGMCQTSVECSLC